DFWGKFASAINGLLPINKKGCVAFDLINEPHTHAESGNKPGDYGISLPDWYACAQAAITAIRATGAENTIFVPGMAYTGASALTQPTNAAHWLTLSDPQKNLAH